MARSRKFHFKKYSIVKGNIKVSLDMSRFNTQYGRAQYQIDGNVSQSMIPFMPMNAGNLVNITRAASAAVQGSGQVYAAFGPQGRFLYEGKGMVGVESGSPWAKEGEKKVLVSQYGRKTNAKEFLSYNHSTHPQAQAEWFEPAKAKDLDKWVRDVKETAGGGTYGK